MPIFTTDHMSFAAGVGPGQVVDVRAVYEPPDILFLQPGDFLEVPPDGFAVRKGIISFSIQALDRNNPRGPIGGSFNSVPVRVEVHKIGDTTPIAVGITPDGSVDNPWITVEADAGAVEEVQRYVQWKWGVRLVNGSGRIAQVNYRIQYTRDSSLISEGAIPIPVLQNTLGFIFNALAPTAHLKGRTLTVGISPEIAEYISTIPEDGQITKDISGSLPVDADGELMSLDVRLTTGAEALQALEQHLEEEMRKIERLVGRNSLFKDAQRALLKKLRDSWHEKIDATDVAVRIDAVFSDVNLILGKLWNHEVTIGGIEDASTKIFLVFKDHHAATVDGFGKGYALVFTPADYEGALEVLNWIHVIPDIGEAITEQANKLVPKIHRYFADAMVHLVGNKYTKRFISFRVVGDELRVLYCDDPADEGAFPRPAPLTFTPPVAPPNGQPPRRGPRRIPDVVAGGVVGGPSGRPPDRHPDTPPPEPIGVVPDFFDLGRPESVARLDKIDTFVVVMMENRSFDHMLGRLSRNRPGRGYICYPDDASNTVPGQSPIRMVHAKNIQGGDTWYALKVDPYHGTTHVKDQINGGAMDGFAADIMKKPDSADRVPQLPLTYYEEDDVKFFYYLADNYMVCDRWFAAHPGGTYPNRWVFLSGQTPYIKNIPVLDPNMGFIDYKTIFDYLDDQDPALNVDWVYYESNVGMLRMYDFYRLDNKKVLPFSDPTVGFAARAKEGKLPPVVFVEPKITGIPPLAQASDDHPPANILRGQEFLEEVYWALRNSPHWEKSLLLITYDEHGGFYDHMPPPGTPPGDADWVNGFPKIHPEGETYLGPRVPTFIVSPHVRRGSVCHTIFDHTAVIKSLLVRFRHKFRSNIFGLFGDRVPMMNHLGAALNLDAADMRVESRMPLLARTRDNFGDVPAPRPVFEALPREAQIEPEEIPYGFRLARAMMPKPKRAA